MYTVHSPIEPVTFNKLKEAKQFKHLLETSTAGYYAEIIRREITEEGYTVSEEKRKW